MFVLSRVLIFLVFEIPEEVLLPMLFLILCYKEKIYHLGGQVECRCEMFSIGIETGKGGYG